MRSFFINLHGPAIGTGIATLLLFLSFATGSYGGDLTGIEALIGKNDAVLVEDADGKILLAKNQDKRLIPASIQKVLTSLVALYYLGSEYRFTTEFYLDKELNLGIKGFGDPLLVSETVALISLDLARRMGPSKTIRNIVTDGSYYASPLYVPGVFALSKEPYDAPNGALCVNFNTVNFKTGKGGFASNEDATPLLPSAMETIQRSGQKRGRVLLSGKENLCMRYAGELFEHFLKDAGVEIKGTVTQGWIDRKSFRPLHTHVSEPSMEEVIQGLLRYSNNFTANQLLLNVGAKVYGPPATLEKGVAAATVYAEKILGIGDLTLVEGSGISRRNRISASMMAKVLGAFKPHHRLMQSKGRIFYKTGTLFGISTRAGYILTPENRPASFVVMVNTPGKNAGMITGKILKALFPNPQCPSANR